MVPSSFRVTVTPTSAPPKPGAAAVRAAGSSAGVSSANRLFTALITPSEVKVAPVTMSTSVNGPALPMNWFTKLSARTRSHTGGSCLLTSMASVAMVPSSFRVTVTPTSAPPKPGAAAVSSLPAGAAGPSSPVTDMSLVGIRLFTALITPSEVKVAPVTMSTFSPFTKGPFLPMNWPRNSSVLHRSHTGGTCWLLSMVSAPIVPSSFSTTLTPTSLPAKPTAAAVRGAAAGISTSSTATPMAALAASITALEVTVAPDRASIPSPRSGVAFLPTNWAR